MVINELIQMYLPALLAALEGASVFFVLLKKIKNISFKKETDELRKEVKSILEDNKKLRNDNKDLKKQLSILIDKNMKINNYEANREHGKQ